MEKIQNKLGFDRMEIWETSGWKGGIAILWNDCMGWEVIYKSIWILGIQILINRGGKWILWGCYGLAVEMRDGSFGIPFALSLKLAPQTRHAWVISMRL